MNEPSSKPVIEPLEGRVLLSALPIVPVKATEAAHVAPVRRAEPARRAKASTAGSKNYLVSFYGLGGGGFGNQWLSKLATEAGKRTGATAWKFQESQGDAALVKLLSAIDLNKDHLIT